jgi:MFS family permease
MVYLATQGASQLQVSVVAASTYAAALMFGIQGGSLSDSLSKRIALVLGYLAQAALCLLVPYFWGTDVGALLFIMFLASAINQVVTPSFKSAIALVATPEQMATVSASVTIVGSFASVIGSAFIAPVLIKYTSIEVILGVGGTIYLLGAIRTWKLPRLEKTQPLFQALRSTEWRPVALSQGTHARWIVRRRAVATMILAGGIAVALRGAFNSLVPVYVRDVLDADPANSVYIFAPAGIGWLIWTLAGPFLMAWIGERRLALMGIGVLSVSTVLFGLVGPIAADLAPFGPLRLFSVVSGSQVSDNVLAAGLIALPANLWSTVTGAAVQVYINRRVPVATQGATFGLQEVQENGLTFLTVISMGALASVVGPQAVFVMAPFVVIAPVIMLLRYAYRHRRGDPVGPGEALGMLTDTSLDQPKRRRRRKRTTTPTTPPPGPLGY